MLLKRNRVGKAALEKVFKDGKFINSTYLHFKFILNGKSGLPQISFVAPKSVARLAVGRNLLRRRGYNALGKYLGHFPRGIVGVFVFKKYQDDISIIEHEIKNIADKIN